MNFDATVVMGLTFDLLLKSDLSILCLGGVLLGEMKFVLSNFLSNEDLSISYES